jgi:uncharacterized protein YndB with AHSA1/START domain
MTRPEIRRQVVYPASMERVWAALTDPAALARWLLPNDFVPELGRRFRFWARSPDAWPQEVQCQVVTLEAPTRLAFTWQDGSHRLPTLVTCTLEAVPAGTLLRLEHTGFDAAVRDAARHRLQRHWARLPQLLQIEVDATALTDELLAFIREPRAVTRNTLPVLAELRHSALDLPLEVLETMVLDGVDQRAFVAAFVTTVLDRPGVTDAGSWR